MNMTETSALVLLIEDELPIRRFLRASLAGEGYRIIESDTGQHALRAASQQPPDLVILDLGLPDLDQAFRAYLAGDHAYFYVPDCDAQAIGTKLVTQLVWYGSVRTPLTFDCMEEWLLREGFHDIRRCDFRRTLSPYPDIVSLDNRPRESFFVEARK